MDNLDLMDKLGVINPKDMSRVFVGPGSVDALKKEFTDVREHTIHIAGFRVQIIESKHMEPNTAWFGGKLFRFGGEDNEG